MTGTTSRDCSAQPTSTFFPRAGGATSAGGFPGRVPRSSDRARTRDAAHADRGGGVAAEAGVLSSSPGAALNERLEFSTSNWIRTGGAIAFPPMVGSDEREPSGPLRLAELLGSVSLATDLGTGQPSGRALRTCTIAAALAEAMGCGPDEIRTWAGRRGGCASRSRRLSTASVHIPAFAVTGSWRGRRASPSGSRVSTRWCGATRRQRTAGSRAPSGCWRTSPRMRSVAGSSLPAPSGPVIRARPGVWLPRRST